MALFKSFTFDDLNSLEDLGIYISGDAVYDAPARAMDMVQIPGRNGALALDLGYFENIAVTYPAGLYGATQAEFRDKIGVARNKLCARHTYCRLDDEYDPAHFRMGVYKSGLEVSQVNHKAGTFNLTFDCKPQRYLTIGQSAVSFTNNGVINNPTLYPARPIIVVPGALVKRFKVGDTIVTINTDSSVVIDSDLQDCYYGSTNLNKFVSFSGNEFPILMPGENNVSFMNYTARQLIIQPRWWEL